MLTVNGPTSSHFTRTHRTHNLRTGALALALSLTLGVSACSTPSAPAADPQATAVEASVADSNKLPQTPAGTTATWVLSMLDADNPPSVDEVKEHFSEAYLADNPAVTTQQMLAETRAGAPYELVSYEDGGNQLLLTMDSAVGARVAIDLTVDLNGKLTKFTATTVDDIPTISSTADLRKALENEKTQTAVLIARIDSDGGGCNNPVFSSNADDVMPVGRIYDLAVLDALTQKIKQGKLSADSELTLQSDTVAPGTGRLQWAKEGAKITVTEAATRAIQENDGTAATLLTDTVGRQAVCGSDTKTWLQNCTAKTLLTPRSLGQIAWSDTELRQKWADADSAGRAKILQSLPQNSLTIDPTLTSDIVWTDDLSWYATATGICQAQTKLSKTKAEGGAAGALVRDALAVHGGAPIDENTWPQATYIGSLAPGQTAMAWTLTDSKGAQWSVVVLQAGEDPLSYPSYAWLAGLSEQIIALIPQLAGTASPATPSATATPTGSPIGDGIPTSDKDPITIVDPEPKNELQNEDSNN